MKVGTLVVAGLMLAMTAGTPRTNAGDLGNAAKALTTMNQAQIEFAKKSYLNCLNSTNEGVVQSAIGIILQWRLINPQEDLSKHQEKISDLALNGSTPGTRFKASLASLVFDSPGIVNFDAAACDDCGQLFDAIAGSVRQMLVGHNLH